MERTVESASAAMWVRGVATLASAGALVLSPALSRPAEACGGFWCSQQNPIDQSAEQIIFVDNPDETVTTLIQIAYVGPSEKFAWLIPIPGEPTIEVSSNTVFSRLNAATMPSYTVERHVEGMCMPGGFRGDCPFCDGEFAPAPSAGMAADESPAVMVLDQGSVGPYNYHTIAVNPALEEPADAAIQWLMGEGYDLSGVDAEVLGPYLASGLNLLAFRLTKGADADVGSIRPVALTYVAAKPMIPIIPTAVAAQADMGIRVWVAAAEQAVPDNYLSLVINEALIDWLNQSYNYDFIGPFGGGFGGNGLPSNYDAVVTQAANEAGGKGFVTELAGASTEYADALFSPEEAGQLASIESAQYADGIDAIWAANSYYRGWDGWREAIVEAVTLPQGATIDEFAQNPDGFRGTAEVDLQVFFDELRNNVVGPVMDAQTLIGSRPYLTRLYSTMSPDEMDRDPVFTYNPQLDDVSNQHVAQMYIECSANVYESDAPWRIELPQGGVIRGEGYSWPIALADAPANLLVVQLSGAGTGDVVTDNRGEIGTMLYEQSGMIGTGSAIPDPPPNGMVIGGDQTVSLSGEPQTGPGGPGTEGASSGGGFCRAAPGAEGAGTLLVIMGALMALIGRRTRRA